MRIRLQGAMEELNRFTQSLEGKVEERTEQLKVAHQKLLKSYRLASLGQLSASVAHEINNPVSGVLNLAMLLQRIITSDGVPRERIDEVKRYLTQIVNETTRVGRIVQDLLAFSRRSTPQRVAADLHVLIDRTVTVLGHKMKLMNVELDLDLEEGLPSVKCDPSQMQQVLFNLIINAGESAQSRPGARVLVSTRSDRARNEVLLRVRDNGEGIRPENLSKIFDPFFTTKPEGKGVGLGLAVVYGIVEAHHGDIEVDSTLGVGTCFTVRVPLEPDAGTSLETDAGEP
jgi:two-component system, NtrC family, sensor kinase